MTWLWRISVFIVSMWRRRHFRLNGGNVARNRGVKWRRMAAYWRNASSHQYVNSRNANIAFFSMWQQCRRQSAANGVSPVVVAYSMTWRRYRIRKAAVYCGSIYKTIIRGGIWRRMRMAAWRNNQTRIAVSCYAIDNGNVSCHVISEEAT